MSQVFRGPQWTVSSRYQPFCFMFCFVLLSSVLYILLQKIKLHSPPPRFRRLCSVYLTMCDDACERVMEYSRKQVIKSHHTKLRNVQIPNIHHEFANS